MSFDPWQTDLHLSAKATKKSTFEVDNILQVRATHGACEGTWFYEVTVTHLGSTGHVRVGWSTRKGELQAPVSYPSALIVLVNIDDNATCRTILNDRI